MNDKIAYTHLGFRSAAGSPVTCSFVAREGAVSSAHEAGGGVITGAQGEKSDRSLATDAKAASQQSVAGSFKSWLVRTLETSFAHPAI
jgi:hypothetical protein